jgi:hydroxyacylglutathione hydrolase
MSSRSSSAPNPPAPGKAPGGSIRIEPIRAFQDNYIWLLERGGEAIIVDPGDAAPVREVLDARGLKLVSIVVTHHHADHVGGVPELVQAYGVDVYGPMHSPFPGIDHRLLEGDRVRLFGEEFQVLEVPGHTLDHIAYWSEGLGVLFCGDTLFACGCGRLFEGTAQQMSASLGKFAALPEDTRVYCAHEYTASNIRFALAVEPGNVELARRRDQCQALRARDEPTVPSSIGLELTTNPFLRCAVPAVQSAAREKGKAAGSDAVSVFAALRSWKDHF